MGWPRFSRVLHYPGVGLTHPEPSNKLKTFHFEPNLWQTAFTSRFLTAP